VPDSPERARKRYAEDPVHRERRRAINRAYYARHRDEVNAKRRHKYANDSEARERIIACNSSSQRKYRYGISPEAFDLLRAEQHNACAICERTPSETLCIDHCHDTGKVRGLLCRRCNSGLGFYDDDPEFMSKAVAYLQHWKRKHAES
jgi:hypothetical protein